MRWFNNAGPCKPDIHYMLPTGDRLPNLVRSMQQQNYFIIHAARQTGKTTAMLNLAQTLTESGQYTAVMVSVEVGSVFPHDIERSEQAILGSWQSAIEIRLPKHLRPTEWIEEKSGRRIQANLQHWSSQSERPIILFIDEIDSLQDEVLVSVLRQLRDGFPNRPQAFPQSIGLVGMRDIRDYKVASGGSDRLNTSSPFNVKAKSLTLLNFTEIEVATLYQQHTTDTGQTFTPEAIHLAFELTQGQPWLVNALAKEVVEELVEDTSIAITPEHINQAKEILIHRQDTHLDSLAERLRENRVKAIIQPMLAGQEMGDIPNDDIRFVIDLGLCRMDPLGGLAIANPIYREVLPRVLTLTPSASLPQIQPTWLTPQGELNIDALRDAFMVFWRQHGEPLLNSASYHEIAPHLVLMAFLHRVINGGGTLDREYAIGSDRMDLCLRYGSVTLGIELKVQRDDRRNQLIRGLEQIDRYLARLGLDFGWLVIFDRRANLPFIEDRVYAAIHQSPGGRSIEVIYA
jgi:type II secretory pathway predicted ATPase ExeA